MFTPTEAASVAVVYGLFLAGCVYRTLTIPNLIAIFRNTIEISGMVLLVIGMCALLGYVLTIFQVPGMLGKLLDVWAPDKILFLLYVQILFFIIGIVMDTVPAILILVPMLTPMAVARGIEPIHFGILIECNIALGFITPPIGNVLYTACAVVDVPLGTRDEAAIADDRGSGSNNDGHHVCPSDFDVPAEAPDCRLIGGLASAILDTSHLSAGGSR